jgi:hypothetical protein
MHIMVNDCITSPKKKNAILKIHKKKVIQIATAAHSTSQKLYLTSACIESQRNEYLIFYKGIFIG